MLILANLNHYKTTVKSQLDYFGLFSGSNNFYNNWNSIAMTQFNGTHDNDSLVGTNNNDIFNGTQGNDTLIGLGGFDTVDYSHLSQAVTILPNGTVQKGDLGIDSLSLDIEEIIGAAGQTNTINATGLGGSTAIDVNLTLNILSINNIPNSPNQNFFIKNFVNVIGSDASDWITGSDEDNNIQGGSGNDFLHGLGGNDTVNGGDGDDTIKGGLGNDSIIGGAGNDSIDGDAGDDTLNGGDGDDTIAGGHEADLIQGGNGNDSLIGNGGDDVILAGDGNDTVDAGAGNDLVQGGDDNDSISGGIGNDTINGNGGNDSINGAAGDDSLVGNAGDDTIQGGLGNDTIQGNGGDDLVAGGAGDDQITGGNDRDFVQGGEGNDVVEGLGGDDKVTGDAGDDMLKGGDGNDSLSGGDGNDGIWGDAGDDTLKGGAGDDLLEDTEGNDLILGGTGNDTTYGGSGNDTIGGGVGDDRLFNGDGNDLSVGDAGNDTINGGTGDDVIYGDNYVMAMDLIGQNLVTNGSFEDNQVHLGCNGIFQSIPGWQTTFGPGIEIKEQAHKFGAAADGHAWVELDSSGNSGMVQHIDTHAGVTYQLSVDYTPRQYVSPSKVEVWWDGEKITTLSGKGGHSNNWNTFTFKLEGSQNDFTSLEFRAAGHSNGVGGFIDNVKVFRVAFDPLLHIFDTEATVGNDELYGEDGNDTLFGGAGSDSLFGGAGNDVLHGTDGMTRGVDQEDRLTGGAGHDTFVLADETGGFYNSQGWHDCVVIQDFTPHEDTIQLSDGGKYWLGSWNGNSYLYEKVDHRWDGVAVLEGVQLNEHDLNNSELFEYV